MSGLAPLAPAGLGLPDAPTGRAVDLVTGFGGCAEAHGIKMQEKIAGRKTG
jgi:hypothetical protein